MKFLFEEFFGKAFNVVNNLHLFFRLLIKLVLLIVLISIMYGVYILIKTENYLVIGIIVVLFLVGEISHLIRKHREKEMVSRITEDNKINKTKNQGLLPKK